MATLYEVTLVGKLFEQQVVSRWTYQSAGTPAAVSGSFALAKAFGAIPAIDPIVWPADTMFDDMRAFVSNSVQYEELVVKDLYSPVDFYTVPFNNVFGKVPEAGTSPTLAWGFKTNRTRLDINRGQKRIPGVMESALLAGGVIDAGAFAAMETYAERMGEVLNYNDEGNTLTFTPVIVGKEKITDPETGKVKYQLYRPYAAQAEHLMGSLIWTPINIVRTQTSRQYKSGA